VLTLLTVVLIKFLFFQTRAKAISFNSMGPIEFCPSVEKVVLPRFATFTKTKQTVELYFNVKNNYFQYFHIGKCKFDTPQLDLGQSTNFKSKCETTNGNYMAEYVIENTNLSSSIKQHNKCKRINEKLSVCRGWIRLSSNCKHFTTPRLKL